jgi:hypothetical protein
MRRSGSRGVSPLKFRRKGRGERWMGMGDVVVGVMDAEGRGSERDEEERLARGVAAEV